MEPEVEAKLKEARLQTRVCILLTVICIPFVLLSWILRDVSEFALEIFGIAVTGILFCLPLTFYWRRTWRKLEREAN